MKSSTTTRGLAALARLAGFVGGSQLVALRQLIRGEEGEWYVEKLEGLASIVESMPTSFGQDGKGDDAMVYLHYFTGPYDSWIIEKDAEPADNPAEAQWQAFGAVRWAQNGPGISLGYVCLPEIFRSHAEIDLHFTPCTLRDLKRKLGLPVEASVTAQPLTGEAATASALDLFAS